MVCFTGSTIQYSGTPYAGEHLHLPSAVRRLGRRGQDLDTQVWRVPNRPIEIDQVRSGRPEEEDVRLYDVVLRKDDVDRSADREARKRLYVVIEPLNEADLHALVPGHGCGDHIHLAVVELVPASVFGRPLQVGEAHAWLHPLHGAILPASGSERVRASAPVTTRRRTSAAGGRACAVGARSVVRPARGCWRDPAAKTRTAGRAGSPAS
jgi:hypothetical protein